MSLRIVLLAIGTVTVVWMLFWTLVAMGPIAWVVIVPMLVVGVVQVYRKRAEQESSDDGVYYCGNCGAEIVPATDDGDRTDGPDRPVDFCTSCGEPVDIERKSRGTPPVRNCPECGAPNDPGAEECDHCRAPL